uniref:Uncharacterized protein n=1 Tax=Arundo donax TaxID=35708 RepID=A0A0A8Z6C2_ARUDO
MWLWFSLEVSEMLCSQQVLFMGCSAD